VNDLAQALADFREEAAVLRRNGHKAQAESIERVVERVAELAGPYIRFVGEVDAVLYSGKQKKALRRLFPELEAQGNAYRDARGRRFFREMCLPRRVRHESVVDDAERAAREDAA
jgi:hypothetical protein